MEKSVTGESKTFLEEIKESFTLEEQDVKTYSPLTLAFIGDCVYDLIIRSLLVCTGNRGVNSLHNDKSDMVKAQTQAKMVGIIRDQLDEEERDILRRGRNAKTVSHAKNAELSEYHKATGLEALFGYLYLTGREERILELVKMCKELDEMKGKW